MFESLASCFAFRCSASLNMTKALQKNDRQASAQLGKSIACTPEAMIKNVKHTFTSKRLQNVRCVLLLTPPAVIAGIAIAIAVDGGVQLQAQQCDPVVVLAQFFDSVTPPGTSPVATITLQQFAN